jgi:hypothetical protein
MRSSPRMLSKDQGFKNTSLDNRQLQAMINYTPTGIRYTSGFPRINTPKSLQPTLTPNFTRPAHLTLQPPSTTASIPKHLLPEYLTPSLPSSRLNYAVGLCTIYPLTNLCICRPQSPISKRNETFMRGVGVSCGGEMDWTEWYGIVLYGLRSM